MKKYNTQTGGKVGIVPPDQLPGDDFLSTDLANPDYHKNSLLVLS